MATIEPRLIHLLNNSQTPDLPPIQLLPALSAASPGESLSLPPLEPDPQQRGDKAASRAPPLPTLAAAAAAADDPLTSHQVPRTDNAFPNDTQSRLAEPVRPLRLLLENTDANTSTLSLRMIVDETLDGAEDQSTKKRHRALTTKDDFVQLPQPLKKQKSTQNVVPPIIAGLHEPPPNAAVFPPITGPFHDSEAAASLGIPKEFGTAAAATDDRTVAPSASEGDKMHGSAKVKRRAAKPRRKWTDEETNHLLLGVSRHGVGKWTSILEDPDFKFNERTAGDLKDRFRTCCPDELRGTLINGGGKRSPAAKSAAPNQTASVPTSEDGGSSHRSLPGPKQRHGILLESILIDPDDATSRANVPENDHTTQPELQSQPDSDSAPAPSAKQPRKSRAHRKKMEDLVELGIRGPFKKSHRRERRPFTEQDDKEILDGLNQYGPAWTKIQRDSRYHLSSRQPTDLRDRVRNKYPEIYSGIEKGSFGVKDSSQKGQGGVLEPAVNTTIEQVLHRNTGPRVSEPELTLNRRSSSREDMGVAPKWVGPSFYDSSSESLPGLADVFVYMGSTGLDHQMAATGTTPGTVAGVVLSPGEMDISRLLLEDSSHVPGAPAPGLGEQQHHHH